MKDPGLGRILDDDYDPSREDTLLGMVKDLYNRRMLSIVVLLWTFGLAFMALAVMCAVWFFRSDQVKDLILYATGFLGSLQTIAILKVFAWQMVHRNGLMREIKRLELRILDLSSKE